ncbi:hypothetical protein [Streptacidiphilus sp. EB129]|uniref:hypothetical protein n=1 Tax=Streptacidiphilus sp. EB129 TaxID=3156262 RepID=UPI003515A5F4
MSGNPLRRRVVVPHATPTTDVPAAVGDWDAIHARHHRELLGSPLDAEEAVQETWLRARRGLQLKKA